MPELDEDHATLFLRLAAPLQSWGTTARFGERGTEVFPTRSGVIGMIASAQGRLRGSDLSDMSFLGVTVRADQPGVMLTDFQTIGGGHPRALTVATVDGKAGGSVIVSRRTYLQDATFVVAITGAADLVQDVATALRAPRWPGFLGRRSCPPTEPLVLGVVVNAKPDLLEQLSVLRRPAKGSSTERVRLAADAEMSSSATSVHDDPVCFDGDRSRWRTRNVAYQTITVPSRRCVGTGIEGAITLYEELNR